MQDEKALTPNELARRYGVSIHKVLGWIKTGVLGAVNVAQDERKRPQWVMLPKHLEAFEAARAPKPARKRAGRRRQAVEQSHFDADNNFIG